MTQKTVQFNTSMLMAKILKGRATVFHIGETDSTQIHDPVIVEGPDFSLDFDDFGDYYYIVLDVYEYLQNGDFRDISQQAFSILAVFNNDSRVVTIGAPSTVAAMYAFAQLMSVGDDGYTRIYGEEARIRIAYGMKNNFTADNGSISEVISNSPNGLETNSYPMFNSLSTLTFYCMTSETINDNYLAMTAPASRSFLKAFNSMVLDPFNQATGIYNLIAGQQDIYTPSLKGMQLPSHKSPVPTNWTLTIKVNDSGSLNFLMAGLAYVVFDKDDKAWIANNFRAGSDRSGTHCPVLNSDGSPASFSPVQGGGLLGAAFGVAIDNKKEIISFGNFGWGPEAFNPYQGSISRFSSDGAVLCSSNGITNGLSRVQGMTYDQSGNLWMASVGTEEPFAPGPEGVYPIANQNSAVVVYLDGDPNKMLKFDNFFDNPSPFHSTFDVAIDSQGNAFVSNIGTEDKQVKSSVHKIRISDDRTKLDCLKSWDSKYYNEHKLVQGYEQYRQVTVNSEDQVLVVGVASGMVTVLDNDLKGVVATYTNNVNGPWGIVIDNDQTIFVSNFAQEKGRAADNTLDMQGPYGVTVIRPGTGDSGRLMTLPTGGAEVTLATGMPLYGNQTGPDGEPLHLKSYEPLMRLTACNVDRAGNLWAMNNWKPSAEVDVKSNPGGDGAVIFVGVAAPA